MKTEFQKQKYTIVKNVIGQELCTNIDLQFKMLRDMCMYSTNNNDKLYNDTLVTENSFAWYAPFDNLLIYLKPKIEEISGLQLEPAYSYGRIYYKNAEMRKHFDRPSCEISMTLNISIDKKPWPIWVKTVDNEDKEIILMPGDGMIYQGTIVEHWRNPYEGDSQTQLFLHWVNANGKYADYKYDHRPILGLSK